MKHRIGGPPPPHRRPDARAELAAERRRPSALGCASTWAWPRAWARPTRCSRRLTAATTVARDVVVGFRRNLWHGATRPPCSSGLEIVPRRRVEVSGVAVEEMDADAINRPPSTVPSGPRRRASTTTSRARRARSAGRTWTGSAPTPASKSSAPATSQHVESIADGGSRRSWACPSTNASLTEVVPGRVDEIELVDHEAARAPAAHAPRQRLSAGSRGPGPGALLHRAEPHGPCATCRCDSWPAKWTSSSRGSSASGGCTSDRSPNGNGSRGRVGGMPACVRRSASIASALHAPLLGVAVETPGCGCHAIASRTSRPTWTTPPTWARDHPRRSLDLARGLRRSCASARITHLVLVHRPHRGCTSAELARRSTPRCRPGLEVHLVGEPAPVGQPHQR